jgi:hypothetical protein
MCDGNEKTTKAKFESAKSGESTLPKRIEMSPLRATIKSMCVMIGDWLQEWESGSVASSMESALM